MKNPLHPAGVMIFGHCNLQTKSKVAIASYVYACISNSASNGMNISEKGILLNYSCDDVTNIAPDHII